MKRDNPGSVVIQRLEAELIEVLDAIAARGWFAPANDDTPRTRAMESRLVREHLATFDDETGRWFLTSVGAQRRARSRVRVAARVIAFRSDGLRSGQADGSRRGSSTGRQQGR